MCVSIDDALPNDSKEVHAVVATEKAAIIRFVHKELMEYAQESVPQERKIFIQQQQHSKKMLPPQNRFAPLSRIHLSQIPFKVRCDRDLPDSPHSDAEMKNFDSGTAFVQGCTQSR